MAETGRILGRSAKNAPSEMPAEGTWCPGWVFGLFLLLMSVICRDVHMLTACPPPSSSCPRALRVVRVFIPILTCMLWPSLKQDRPLLFSCIYKASSRCTRLHSAPLRPHSSPYFISFLNFSILQDITDNPFYVLQDLLMKQRFGSPLFLSFFLLFWHNMTRRAPLMLNQYPGNGQRIRKSQRHTTESMFRFSLRSCFRPLLCEQAFVKTSWCANSSSFSVLSQVGQFSEFLHECTSQ